MAKDVETQSSRARTGHVAIRDEHARRALGPRYEPTKLLGVGASAVVYQVLDHADGYATKAAKVTRLVSDQRGTSAADLLREEFRLASHIEHPHLVRYYDLDIYAGEDLAVTTMEFVEGCPFGAELGPCDAATICDLMIQLLRGLRFLHDAGYVHGDVKPSNVLCRVSEDRASLKLLDYHLAFRPSEIPAVARGTLRYMAPEVIAGGRLDARSDLYSAGVLFYEGLTGAPLFQGSPNEVAAQHLTAPVGEVGRLDLQEPHRLVRVLARFLAKRPEGRYANAAEAIGEIAEATGKRLPAETPETLLGGIRSVPLVGRDGVIQQFERALVPQIEPEPPSRVFLVHARSGLGKTRVLRECEVLAQLAGFKTFRLPSGVGEESIIDRMERYLGVDGAPARDHVERLPVAPGTQETLTADAGLRLPREVLSRLDRLAEAFEKTCPKRRTAFFLDDVERLRAEGIETLLLLVRMATRYGGVFCLTSPDLPTVRDPLAAWIGGLHKEAIVTAVPLEELNLAATRNLVAAMLPPTAPAEIVQRLADRCGGSPSIVTAVMEHLVVTGCVGIDSAGRVVVTRDPAGAVPEDIRHLATEVYQAVGGPVRKALELLAIGDQEMELAVLSNAVGLEASALRDGIETCRARETVSLRQVGPRSVCRYLHPSFASAILANMPPQTVRLRHDQLARALERCSNGRGVGTANRVAMHRLRGRHPARGLALALKTLERVRDGTWQEGASDLVHAALPHASGAQRMALLEIGGDLECRRGSFAEAAKAFREALEFCQRASPGRPRLLRKLATTLAGLGQYAEAHRLLSEFLGLEATSGRELLREIGRARLLLAWTCLTQSKPEQALEHCGGAARVAERIKDHYILATALMWSATAHLLTKSAGEARGALVQAFWKFRALRDKGDVARVLAMLGRVAMLTRKWRQAERLLQRSLPMLRAEGCLDEAARTMVEIGTIHHKLCGWEAAAAQYREARVLYERLGHSRGKAVALVNLSQLNASRGWLDSAVAEAKEALDTAPEDPEFRCHALLCLARAEYALGDLEAAHRAALEALRTATELNLTSQLESAHRILGEVEALRREVSSAREHLQVALSLSERQKMPHREAICLARLAEAAIASGDLATAHSLAESAHQKAAQSEAQPVIAVVDLVKGKIALAAEKPREALDWLRRAHQVFARGGGCDDQVEVTLHLAKAFVALEKFRFAAFYCRAALDIVDQVAARLRSERERALFYADPRRRAVLALIHSLRTQVENREDT